MRAHWSSAYGPAALSFDALVLAGGRGSRAGGADKPGLTVGGRTMAAAVVSAAVGAGAQRVVVVGPDRPDLLAETQAPPWGLSFVREEPAGAGPVPALVRGLAEVQAPLVAVLAADLPFLRSEDVRSLIAMVPAWQPRSAAGAIMVDERGREQWLVSAWRTEALREAAAVYQGGSLGGLLGPLEAWEVRWEPAPGEPPPWLDCDTADDVARARDWHERRQREGEVPE